MTRIAQLEDQGAVVAWSPVSEYADVIALGSKEKGGIGFDDYGGELELYDLNITRGQNASPILLGNIKTTTRFASIAWSSGSPSAAGGGMGLLAGGMIDGTVNVWSPSSLLSGGGPAAGAAPNAQLASIQRHSNGAVSALRFNPHAGSMHMLASGGSNGEVLIMELDNADQPNVYSPGGDGSKQGAEITQVAWNSQVSHILASSAGNGTVVVWDLRQKKPWCELRCELNSGPVSDMAWNPTQGLHMMTASGDDRSPGLKLWDLRASTTMPLTTLEGHSQGILSMAWCPHDDTLMLSCGKDNRTLLWDLYSLQPIAEIPNDDSIPQTQTSHQNSSTDFYGGGLGTSQQKRYDVQWSPLRRGVVSTCSFDRKVQAHSVIGLATKCGRPPKWMSPASGVSCGFGGVLVSVASSQKYVKMETIVEHPDLVKLSEKFESEFSSADCISFCRTMAGRSTDEYESQVWSFMQIMFETNAREQLLNYLGFDPERINQAATEYVEDETNPSNEEPTPAMSKHAEDVVKDALLVGNFEAAVECCFRAGNLADALVLASCGGAELWAKTQAEYFQRQAKKRPFLSLVSAVIHSQLTEFVSSSDPLKWKETLAVLSTYGKSEEFPVLCSALGDRLEESGDFANASLCYLCASNLGQAVKYWKITLQKANQSFGGKNLSSLHNFVEKVAVFTQTLDPNHELDDDVSGLFADYSKALAEQGLLVSAAKYLKGNTQECKELRDRIYRSRMGAYCPELMASPPEFPYSYTNVGVARDLSGITIKQAGSQPMTQQPQTKAVSDPVANKVQQPQQQQQQHTQQTQQQQIQQQQPQQQPQETKSPSLPPGWVALQDPASGRTYYANQSTGESTWDPPTNPTPQPSPAYAAQSSPSQNYGSETKTTAGTGSVNGTTSSTISTTQKVANKYGDGFVTSASHPQLAEQYGNVGTSNPYSSASRPGTAASALGPGHTKRAPVSGNLDPNNIPALSKEHQYLSDGLLAIASSLTASAAGPTEKRQASESQKGVAVFIKTLARGGVDADVTNKVRSMLSAIQNRDYQSASSIITGLISNEWKDHKDWLKGMKCLAQMASKKL